MKKSLLIIIILILLILLFWCACFHKSCVFCKGNSTDTVKHWLSWNLFFDPSKVGNTASAVQDLEDYLTTYVHSINPSASLVFKVNHCPCDSILTNLDATLLGGSGYTIPAPPTSPNPRPSGDYVLSNNLAMNIPDYGDSTNRVDTGNLVIDTTRFVPDNSSSFPKTLAVIDTGLDTLAFKLAYPSTVWGGNLLWQAAPVGTTTGTGTTGTATTQYNLVPDSYGNILIDNNPVKHGTAATGIVLQQIFMRNRGRIPRIMSLRAFDDSERGSIYTASCAMNCAIDNRADYINASWGYFGHEDTVLKYYMTKASRKGIGVFAAAGNTPGHHESAQVCSGLVNTQNDLTRLKSSDSLFYPASFAPIMDNVVSVTQLNDLPAPLPNNLVPCYYQNYSPDFITVGAYENARSTVPCCSFHVPFLLRNIEGSSFATPVVTGIIMSTITNVNVNLKMFINTTAQHAANGPYTQNGNYFNFANPNRN